MSAVLEPKSKWKCPCCASENVQISLPVWFTETQTGELTQVEIDAEADPRYWCCEDCDETGDGEPDRSE
jgi:hypothetical protein